MRFKNRTEAGKQLLSRFTAYKNKPKTVVLGLPRGGVVVAYEISRGLNAPLDIVVPRKIGAPGNEEFAIGAITETGKPILDRVTVTMNEISPEYIEKTVQIEQKEAKRRLEVYRGGKPAVKRAGKTVILVDDGIATGATMRAAIASVRADNPQKIIVAVPVAASDSLKTIEKEADEVICLHAPYFFGAVGAFYDEFAQTGDEEVIELMNKT